MVSKRNVLKIILVVIPIIAALLVMLPPAAVQNSEGAPTYENNVPYVYTDGNTQFQDNVMVLDATEFANLSNYLDNAPPNNGWYIVKTNITLTDMIYADGNINLIIADNCKLTVSDPDHAIEVFTTGGGGGNLSIWSQPVVLGKGELFADTCRGVYLKGNDCSLTNTAIITAGSLGFAAVYNTGSDARPTVLNGVTGVIQGYRAGIDFNNVVGNCTVINNGIAASKGQIIGIGTGTPSDPYDVYGIHNNSARSTLVLDNKGIISANTNNGCGVFSNRCEITNEFLIEGRMVGVYTTIFSITNTGTIQATSTSDSYGIQAPAITPGGPASKITNNPGAYIGGGKFGIIIDNEATGTGVSVIIENSGSIRGIGTIGTGIYINGVSSEITNAGGGGIIGNRGGIALLGVAATSKINNNAQIGGNGLTANGIYVRGTAAEINNQSSGLIWGGTLGSTAAGAPDYGIDNGGCGIRVISGTGTTINNNGSIGYEPIGPSTSAYGIQALVSVTIKNGETNAATIQGDTYGIFLDAGGTVTNYSTGTIRSLDTAVWVEDGTVTNNNGGTIQGTSDSGVKLVGNATLNNSGSVSGTASGVMMIGTIVDSDTVINAATGAITGAVGIKISQNVSGTIENRGTITSTGTEAISVTDSTGSVTLKNFNLITGNVSFQRPAPATVDVPNYVTFGAGSKIAGNFNIGRNHGTTLHFTGDLSGQLLSALKYAEVTGDTNIGNKTVEVSFDYNLALLPVGYDGETITLIDGSAGTMTTWPENDDILTVDYSYVVLIEGNNLILEPGNKITVTIDPNGAGTVYVGDGTTILKTFTGAGDYIVLRKSVTSFELSVVESNLSYKFAKFEIDDGTPPKDEVFSNSAMVSVAGDLDILAQFVTATSFPDLYYRVTVNFNPGLAGDDGAVDMELDFVFTHRFNKTGFYNIPVASIPGVITLIGNDGVNYMFVGFDSDTASVLDHTVGAEKFKTVTANFDDTVNFPTDFYRVTVTFVPAAAERDGSVDMELDGTQTYRFNRTGFYNIPAASIPNVITLIGNDGMNYMFVGFDTDTASVLDHTIPAGETELGVDANFEDATTFPGSFYRVTIEFDPASRDVDGTVDMELDGVATYTFRRTGFFNIDTTSMPTEITLFGNDGTLYMFVGFDLDTSSVMDHTVGAETDLYVIAHFMDATEFPTKFYRVTVKFVPAVADGAVDMELDGTPTYTFNMTGFYNIRRTAMPNLITLIGKDGTSYMFVGFDSDTASVLDHTIPAGETSLTVDANFEDSTNFPNDFYRVTITFDPATRDVDGTVDMELDSVPTYTFRRTSFYNIDTTSMPTEIALFGNDGTLYMFVGFDLDTSSDKYHTVGAETELPVTAHFQLGTTFPTDYYRVTITFDPATRDVDGTVDMELDGVLTKTFTRTGFYNIPIASRPAKITLTGTDGIDYMFVGFNTSTASVMYHTLGAETSLPVTAHFQLGTTFPTDYYRVTVTFDPVGANDDGSVDLEFGGSIKHTYLRTGFYNIRKAPMPAQFTLIGNDGTNYMFVGFDTDTMSYKTHTVAGEASLTVLAKFELNAVFPTLYNRLTVTITPAGTGTVNVTGGAVNVNFNRNGFVNVPVAVANVTLTATPIAGKSFIEWREDASGNAAVFNLAINTNKRATAVFGNPFIPPVTTTYYITATSDTGLIISPRGLIEVEGGRNQTFTFSAPSGLVITGVLVNGVPLSQAEVASGSYTFFDVKANHTIYVQGRDSRTDLTLTIVVKEGSGYAQYSINGGPTLRYSSSVTLRENDNVTVKAFANDGNTFREWRQGATIFTNEELSFPRVSSSISLELYFTSDDAKITDSSLLLWILIAIILLILLALLIWYLFFYRRTYDVIKVGHSAEIEGKDRVRRKSEYSFTLVGGASGTVSYRIGEDGQWVVLTPNADGVYTVPKGVITDTLTIEHR